MKKIVKKKISIKGKASKLRVQAISADRDERMQAMEVVSIHSGVIDQLRKIRARATSK